MMVQGGKSTRAGRASLLSHCDNEEENKLLKTFSAQYSVDHSPTP